MKLSFCVAGPPIPKARARRGRGGHFYTPETTRAYERTVALAARVALMTSSFRTAWPMDAKYMVRAQLYFPDARRRDSDNVLKALLDSMRGVLFADDHRVGIECPPWEIDRRRPRAEVTVEVVR